jgi:UDP-GlcNAc:undecaprenyl-phosphate GlcNAc-1-phosphate transferase
MNDVLGFLLALGITAAAIPALARAAAGWGLIAHSGSRKKNAGDVPAIGGIAMGTAFLATYALTGLVASPSQLLAVSVLITLAGGMLDDRYELHSLPKFGFQIAAAVVLAANGDALLTHLGALLGPNLFTLGRWAIPLTVFALVGVMNAINMADGLDGLAGSLTLAACVNFGVAASLAGNAPMLATILIVAGATVGFLYFNLRLPWRAQARVFMGDTGSLLLGLLLGWFAVRLATAGRPALAPITAVWILALPIGDAVTLLVRRTLHGRSPFRADRQHLHHILVALGLSPGTTVAVMAALSFVLGAAGLAAAALQVPEYAMFYTYVTGLIAYGFASELACRKLGLKETRDRTRHPSK